MPLLPVHPTKAAAYGGSVAEQFRHLAATWHRETDLLSSVSAASSHPAYQEIIGLGSAVVPLLLRDMEHHETHWFSALRQLTNADPVPASEAGHIPKMVYAWLRWAKDQGYQW
jgi:hypothetical protein